MLEAQPRRQNIFAIFAILITSAFVLFSGGSSASADTSSDLTNAQMLLRQCQLDLQFATTSAERTRAQQCITIKQKVIAGLTSPSPSPSPSATSTPTPSPTVTTPPPTTTTPPPTPTPTPTPTQPPGACPVSGSNVPGGKDPWGGCFPGPGNTGVPAGTVLTDYTGPCTITVANTVIDSKTITCASLLIQTTGVTVKNSMLNGVDLDNGSVTVPSSYAIIDSTVVNGAREQCGCVAGRNFTALRVNIVGGNRSAYCISNCTIQDSWLHGQQLQGSQHGSGLREEQFTTAEHNTLVCDFNQVNDTTSLGCSADLTGYPDFAPIHDNTIHRNLFLSAVQGNCSTCDPGFPPVSYCLYGGNSQGKPFSSDPANATNQKFTENVFQRGAHGQCGFYGPDVNFSTTRTGNVWSGNVFDDGTTVLPLDQ